MDPKPPRRRVWRIHLSTAVAATICAGAMLGVNILWRESYKLRERFEPVIEAHNGGKLERAAVSGWPYELKAKVEFSVVRSLEYLDVNFVPFEVDEQIEADGSHVWQGNGLKVHRNENYYCVKDDHLQWHLRHLAVNGATALAICIALIVLLEFLIRRREARRGPNLG